MSTISRVTVQTYQYELDDFGGSMMVYEKGATLVMTKFVVVVETDDGLRGEYAPHFGASPSALAQATEMAPYLIGKDAEHRTKIYEDLKHMFRHFDRVGVAAIDAALWDLAGKKYRTPISKMLGGYRERIPAYASTFPGQAAGGGLNGPEG